MVGFSAADFGSGKTLEAFSETTAVGDRNLFPQPPESAEPSEQILTLSGRSFAVASRDKVKIHDSEMTLLGRDEVAGYGIYSPRSKSGTQCYVKIDVGEFLPLKKR
jgi:hypothetical protein